MFRYAVILSKLGVPIVIGWYIAKKINIDTTFVYLKSISPSAIFFTFILLFMQNILVALRVHELLSLLKQRCNLWLTLSTVIIGTFFSQTFISFIGGDAMRVWQLVSKNVALNVASKTIFFDRMFGFLGLALLIALSLPLLWPLLPKSYTRYGIQLIIILAIMGCSVFFFIRKLLFQLKRWRFTKIAASLMSVIKDIVEQPIHMWSLIGNSMLIQMLNIFVIYILANDLNIKISFTQCSTLIPLVLFLSMVPLSFAGWGIRESAMIIMLNLINIPTSQSLALSIGYGLSLVIISLPGSLLWIIDHQKKLFRGIKPEF